MAEANAQPVLWEKRGHVRILTYNRPEAMNAISPAAEEIQGRCLEEFRDDPEARVLIVTGSGRAFCTGLDLKARAAGMMVEPRPFPTLLGPTPIELWKPVIAAINGYCLGGGLETALGCDIRIAADDARIGLPEVKRALIPGRGGIQRLIRQTSFGDALFLMFTGDWIDAAEAHRIGLVQRVVPAAELLEYCVKLAEGIAANAPLAVQNVKEAAYRGQETPLTQAMYFDRVFAFRNRQSEDAKEGPKAFAEKRKPEYKGR